MLRWDLLGPIGCQAANKLESESSAPFNLTVFCKCCSHRSHVLKAEQFSVNTHVSARCGRARGLWTFVDLQKREAKAEGANLQASNQAVSTQMLAASSALQQSPAPTEPRPLR